jgi:hypothetical protein
MQGDKCLADICRPVALDRVGGGVDVVHPNATSGCCLLSLHTRAGADDRCFLVEVCEGADEPAVRPLATAHPCSHTPG